MYQNHISELKGLTFGNGDRIFAREGHVLHAVGTSKDPALVGGKVFRCSHDGDGGWTVVTKLSLYTHPRSRVYGKVLWNDFFSFGSDRKSVV